MCTSWLAGQLIMPQESIHLADLYKHDEIYWVPADRMSSDSSGLVAQETKVAESSTSSDTSSDQVSETTLEAKEHQSVQAESTSAGFAPTDSSPRGSAPKMTNSDASVQQDTSSHVLKPADSFEYEPTLDAEASPKPLIPGTTWLVVGDLSGAERGRLQLIFSAPPMLLSEQDWAIYTPNANEPALSVFIEQAQNKKFVFLGQQPAVWQSDFQVTEIVQQADKLIYFFPRLLSTLTDAEKSLKLVFWNAIKDMK
jgi:hypothetical protein